MFSLKTYQNFTLFILLLMPLDEVQGEVYKSEKYQLGVQTVASGLVHPWAIAFLPDGGYLVTERPGRIRRVSKAGQLSEPLKNVPKVHAQGQGGMLDLVLDPDFATNQQIYFSYAEPVEGQARTVVASAKLEQAELTDVKLIFKQNPKASGGLHFGSRLVFAADKTLFIGLGERYQLMQQAQLLDNHLGKVIRINPDGTIPSDNPFVNRKNALAEIWSYGHRNIQGGILNPLDNKVWFHEHGPKGGDELNIPQAGKNYGWPIISYGIDYSGKPIAQDTKRTGMEQPVHQWTPSIAPSGMAIYTGNDFPQWKNNLFVGSLKFRLLVRLVLDGDKVTHEEHMLKELSERIRDVRMGPDGFLYLLTDSAQGRILRVEPVRL